MRVHNLQRLNKHLVRTVPFLFFSPIVFFQIPLWDGVLTDVARSRGFELLDYEADMFGIPGYYFIQKFISITENISGVNFYVLYYLLLVGTVLFLEVSIRKLFQDLKKKQVIEHYEERDSRILGLMVFLFFPLASNFSTQNYFWLLCLTFNIFGVHCLISSRKPKRVLGVILLLLSGIMPSNVFATWSILLLFFCQKKNSFWKKIFLSVAATLFSAVYLLLTREILTSPSGLYEEYFRVHLNVLSDDVLLQRILNFFAFFCLILFFVLFLKLREELTPFVYFVILLGLFLLYKVNERYLLVLGFRSLVTVILDFILITFFILKFYSGVENLRVILTSFFIFITCSLPYALTYKSPNIFDLSDWANRHGMILILSLYTLGYGLRPTMRDRWTKSDQSAKKYLRQLSTLIAFLALTILPIQSFVQAWKSMDYTKRFITLVESKGDELREEGAICVKENSPRLINFRYYELNWIFWKALGSGSRDVYLIDECEQRFSESQMFLDSLDSTTRQLFQEIYLKGRSLQLRYLIEIEIGSDRDSDFIIVSNYTKDLSD